MNEGITLRWKSTRQKEWAWLSSLVPKSSDFSLLLTPKEGKTVIDQNFIEGGSLPAPIGLRLIDQATPIIKSAQVAADGKSVRLVIDGLVRGHVHHLKATGVKSASGLTLWHPEAFYTLNEIPK